MNIYRVEIHGHLLEVRYGSLGGQTVLVDGRPVSSKPWAGFVSNPSHHFTLEDEQGQAHHVEVRLRTPSLVGNVRAIVIVDGVERCRLDPTSQDQSQEVCTNCGYSLRGLPIDNGEVRCPECGRHTSARLLGRSQ